jgi:hypothetical protein
VLSIGDLQLVIEPKIPPNHLLFLFAKSGDAAQLVVGQVANWLRVPTAFTA